MRALISWSGGKDCYWALRVARESGIVPVALVTSFDEAAGRIPIHGVAMTSIERHAEVLGLPLQRVPLPYPCPNTEYLRRWSAVWTAAVSDGIDAVVFGDIHLADIRAFREQALLNTGLAAIFPLWGRESRQLAEEMIAADVDATVTAVDESRLSRDLIGRRFDSRFLADLPAKVDACGENGEFHTLVRL